MINCNLCPAVLSNRQDVIKHLEQAHYMVRAGKPQAVQTGDYFAVDCPNYKPGDTHCRDCGGSLKMFWHGLGPALVDTLVVVADHVQKQQLNVVRKSAIELSHSQYGNFQKLRYFGLIHHLKDDDGKEIRDAWLITSSGWKFLRGDWAAAARVQTFQNRIMQRSPERVTIHDVMRKKDQVDYWPRSTDFKFDLATPQLGLAL